MSYQVLARKWRPRRFSEVIGQSHITRTLQNTIKSQKVAHAYLLTGTRGVGKTTVARIFAKSLRCQNLDEDFSPCLECVSCKSIDDSSSLDYIEVDGASNTGVDNIRELIENVQYLPTSGDKKVYVIDEVHMLSVNAFNALLKTLEEPPAHVVFIFATTDPQKLLGTVLSRCQRFDFKHVDIPTLTSHLKNISEKENIKFEKDSLIVELAKFGEGSVRDTLSLLDQVLSLSADEIISEDILLMSLGLAKTRSVNRILNSIFLGDKEKLIDSFNSVSQENIDMFKFSKQVLDAVFNIIENVDSLGQIDVGELDLDSVESLSVSELLWIYEVLLKDLRRAQESIMPLKMILFSFIKVTLRSEVLGIKGTKLVGRNSTDKKKTRLVSENLAEPTAKSVEAPKSIEAVDELVAKLEEKKEIKKSFSKKSWEEVISYLLERHKTLGVNFEHGNIINEISYSDSEVKIEVGFSKVDRVFYDYLNGDQQRKKVNLALAELFQTDKRVSIKLTLLDEAQEESMNFLSKAQTQNKEIEKEKDRKIKEIKSNKYIQEAQELFGRELGKVRLNKN